MKRILPLLVIALLYFVIAKSDNAIYESEKSGSLIPYAKKITHPILLSEELPEDFPKIVIDTVNEPTEGHILMECFQVSANTQNYIMIMDEQGKVIWQDKPSNLGIDFKIQPNGRYSYASAIKLGDKYQAGPLLVQNIYVQHKILDEEKNIIDSVRMQNEYLADMHDFRILPNGNYLMIAYERVPIDMSKLIPNGNPNAIVVGTVIQELDKDKNCVFQWRSLDFVPVLATKDDPRKAMFEHVHGNSLFQDKDGNVIVTFPTTFEIVKLDMVTGEIIWSLGGDYNQFEITGENEVDKPYYFRMQHDAKILPNGNLLFYDNAVQKKSGWNSRAVEYSLDEENMKAHLVWEYKHNPPVTAYAMGSAQRLENGNTLINWGLMFMGINKGMTEVTPEKEIKFELTFPAQNFSYRAQKISNPPCQPVASVDKYEMLTGNTYLFNDGDEKTGVEVYFKELDAFMYNMMNVKKYDCNALDPEFEGEAPIILPGRYVFDPKMLYTYKTEVRFDVSTLPLHVSPDNLIVYAREMAPIGVFTALNTSYNSANNQLVTECEKFGEFIIGFEREATQLLPPTLMYPRNNKSYINNDTVRIVWSSTGRYDSFNLQIAEDTLFTNVIFDSVNIKSSVLYKSDFEQNKKYFWRVKTSYRDITSDWSDVRTFNFTEPFLTILYPSGGEEFAKDSTIAIRWNTNISDSLSVKLHLNSAEQSVLTESLISHYNAVNWKIASTLTESNNYTIVVTDKDNNNLTAESNAFTIKNAVSVKDNQDINQVWAELETSPNPASDNVQISLNLKKDDFINLGIYDALGNRFKTVLDTYLGEGYYNIPLQTLDLPQGVYYCLLRANDYSIVKKVIIIR